MSIFRRLSISFMGGSSGDEEPRPPHRNRHSLHRAPKNYDVSPTGGNRPISITADPRRSITADPRKPQPPQNTIDGSPPPVSPTQQHHSSRRHSHHHASSSDPGGRPPRKHRSRADTAGDPAPRRSSRKRMSGVLLEPASEEEPPEPERAPPPPPAEMVAPIPIAAQSNRVSASSSAGSSMGIIISGRRKRRGTDGSESSTPLITATPPTPSPLEQARRAHTHPGLSPFAGFPGGAPPPYPVTPPESRNGEEYVAYAVSKMVVGTPEHDSLLHRYRSNFDPRVGRAELSSEPEPVEIGSSDSIYQPPRPPPRTDSGKSFGSSSHETALKKQQQQQPSAFHRTKGSLRENQYEFLRTFDTVFVIDDSASMDAFTRWTDTRTALETIATIATKYDSDGIDVHFLNSTQHDARNLRSAAEVRRLFDLVRPAGITPIAACLDRILRNYLDMYATARTALSSPPTSPVGPGSGAAKYPKPLNIIVLTDGEPTDDPESVIVDAARRLDMLNAPLCQVGIQFFQIGDEEGAREALEDLDDALAEIYGIRDMVDYTPYIGDAQYQQQHHGRASGGEDGDGQAVTGEWILKVLTGAVNRRLDRVQNSHSERKGWY